MGVWYATREQIKGSLEVAHTARANRLIDQKADAGARAVEGLLHRRFYPEIKTIRVDYPNFTYSPTWQVWLPEDFISVSSLVSGGVTIAPADYILRRGDDRQEPPYNRLEILLSSNAALGGGATWQQDITITGLAGFNEDAETAAVLDAALNDSITTVVLNPTDGVYRPGVGSILMVDDERMITTERRMVDTTVNLAGTMDALKNDLVLAVADGTLFGIDEILLIDAERMRVVDIAGNNLIVERAFDGTPLAAHSVGADVYALRAFTVTRGALGTTAAAHGDGATVTAHLFPALVNELGLAEAVVLLEQNTSAYARVVGSGANARESSGQGLADVRALAIQRYGKVSRIAAV